MSLAGRTKTKTPPAPAKIRISDVLEQLDSEWETLKHDSVELHGLDRAGLLAYYHSCLRVSLHWISGDPYAWQPPQEYQQERLAKMCRYLAGLRDADTTAVKMAREGMVDTLHRVYPAFCRLAYPDMPANWPGSVTDWECPPFSWEAIESLWSGQNWEGNQPAVFLPAFRYQETADFHLAALALLFLNRQLRYYLTDLEHHPVGVN